MNNQNVELVQNILILVFIITAFVSGQRFKKIPVLRYISYWAGIILILILSFAYLDELGATKDRFMAELIPGYTIERDNEMMVKRAGDQHFYLYVTMNGKSIRFMVDTGASHVVVSRKLAKEIGIDVDSLKFIYTAYTANGETKTARAVAEKVNLPGLEFNKFPIDVSYFDLETPLLGIEFLSKLKSYRFQRNSLYLKY